MNFLKKTFEIVAFALAMFSVNAFCAVFSEGLQGSVIFTHGPMWAGKSSALIQKMEEELWSGRTCLTFSLKGDLKSGIGKISSRDVSLHCKEIKIFGEFDLTTSMMPQLERAISEKHHSNLVILIDEAQFLPPGYVPIICQMARERCFEVYAYGLDFDFKKDYFPASQEWMKLADVKVPLCAKCFFCEGDAEFTGKYESSGKRILEGDSVEIGESQYSPVCEVCFSKDRLTN